MTEKLYENDSLLRSCQSVVLACTKADLPGQYLIELDRTVFFPEGGGQLSDRGQLGGVQVLHVSEKNGHIYHECSGELAVGQQVEAVLDWDVRLDRIQQHLGEHLLSYACWKLFAADNVGFHMSEEGVRIDLNVQLTDAQLLEAELLTNQMIWENRPVRISYIDSTEIDAIKEGMRKYNSELSGQLRIVTVEGADICTCCGTHPPYTGMVGSVKIIRQEKHKQGCRVEFLCGRRALLDADFKNRELLDIAAGFSTKPELVRGQIIKLTDELNAVIAECRERLLAIQQKALLDLYSEAPLKADGTKLLVLPMEGYDAKDVKNMLPVVANLEQALTLLVAVKPERISYAVVAGVNTGADCRKYMQVVNAAFAGRGGGKPDCTQGGSDYCEDWRGRLAKLEEELLTL